MSNSPLVTYTRLSPNHTAPRNHVIDTISIHCVVGQLTAQGILDLPSFNIYDPVNGSSCTYAVGKDGSIGQGVDEANRSWCTSNRSNDHRAITIEVASNKTHPYAVNDKAMAALLNLLVDICQRHGKKKLLWLGEKEKTLAYTPAADEMVLTVHRWFANKACPGQYLLDRHGEIAAEVTKRLDELNTPPVEEEKAPEGVYLRLNDVPLSYRPTILKLMENKWLGGYADPDPDRLDDNLIRLDETYCRVMTTLDRAGIFELPGILEQLKGVGLV